MQPKNPVKIQLQPEFCPDFRLWPDLQHVIDLYCILVSFETFHSMMP